MRDFKSVSPITPSLGLLIAQWKRKRHFGSSTVHKNKNQSRIQYPATQNLLLSHRGGRGKNNLPKKQHIICFCLIWGKNRTGCSAGWIICVNCQGQVPFTDVWCMRIFFDDTNCKTFSTFSLISCWLVGLTWTPFNFSPAKEVKKNLLEGIVLSAASGTAVAVGVNFMSCQTVRRHAWLLVLLKILNTRNNYIEGRPCSILSEKGHFYAYFIILWLLLSHCDLLCGNIRLFCWETDSIIPQSCCCCCSLFLYISVSQQAAHSSINAMR